MPKKSKSKNTKLKKAEKCDVSGERGFCAQPSVWIISILAVALIAVAAIGVCGVKYAEQRSDIELAQIETFDEIAGQYIRDLDDLNGDGTHSYNTMTGYGVSAEDGVFYITFESTPYTVGDNGSPVFQDTKHAIVYFWKDADTGHYSQAYSYPETADDHPAGEYYLISDEN